jgi:hypothetical protein
VIGNSQGILSIKKIDIHIDNSNIFNKKNMSGIGIALRYSRQAVSLPGRMMFP